jgi:hypothetical protein
MTVCIATLAEDSRVIVLVADKASTIGAMQDDTDAKKILPLTAGNGGRCDAIVRAVSAAAASDKNLTKDVSKLAKCIEHEYRALRDEILEQHVLAPHLLTRTLWTSRSANLLPLPNSVMGEVQDRLSEFEFDCELLFCGFDGSGKPNILHIDEEAVTQNITNEWFWVIGIRQEASTGRLLWQEIRRTKPLGRVLYETFDAKAHAEQLQGVGLAWDVRVILGTEKIVSVPPKIKTLIEGVYICSMQSPFGRRLRRKPRNWRKTLEDYAGNLVEKHLGPPKCKGPRRERSTPATRASSTKRTRT